MLHRACLAAFVVATACVAPVFAQPASSSGPTITQFLKIRVPGGAQVGPGGEVYTRDFPDGIFQLYRRGAGDPIDTQGKKLTSFADGLSSYILSPDGKFATLEAAAGGNENDQIYLLNTATDEITPLLQNPKVQYAVNLWLRDSSGFIYTANDVSPRDFYIYKFDLATKQSTLLWSNPGQWSCSDVSDDKTRLLIGEFRSISDSSIYQLETSSGILTELSAKPADGTASNNFVGYTKDEDYVIFSSDFENGFVQLYSRDLADPQAAPRPVLPTLAQVDLDQAAINESRDMLATVHNQQGFGGLRVFRLPQIDPIMIPPMDQGVVGINQFTKDVLVHSLANARTPGLSYAMKLDDSAPKTLPFRQPITTRLDKEPVDLTTFLPAQLVKYPSFDGVEIPAFLYLPADYKKGTPIPFVAHFHGGPEGQWRPTFDRTVQYLVSKGYGVIQPNVRGSTGYGREFHMMDNYKKRWDSVKDGVEAARWLVKQGYAEPGRVAAFGGSYGGFMAVATVIEGADVFGASVKVVGIVNMKTFLEQTSGYRQKLREAEYGPLSDPEFLLSVSPIMRIDEIKVPMMIAHGANDPRVPVGEAMQLAVALQKRGFDPEQLYFHDEGHGFAKLENRILFSERMVKFLDQHIGKGKMASH